MARLSEAECRAICKALGVAPDFALPQERERVIAEHPGGSRTVQRLLPDFVRAWIIVQRAAESGSEEQ